MVVGGYVITAKVRRHGERASRSRVYVSAQVANERDRRLRELVDAEAALGDRRFADRGVHQDVDELYDKLNRRIAYVERVIAVEAARKLSGNDEITGKYSRWAGCSCGCSPGVVLDRAVCDDEGRQLDMWITTQQEERRHVGADQHAMPVQAQAPAAEKVSEVSPH